MFCEYEKFFTEVSHLKDPSDAPTKQHEIYFNEIQKFIKKLNFYTITSYRGPFK